MSDAHDDEHQDSSETNETTGPMLVVIGVGIAAFLSMGTTPSLHSEHHGAPGTGHGAWKASESEATAAQERDPTAAPSENLTMDEAAAKEAAAAMLELEKELAAQESFEETDALEASADAIDE